jgi:hypothetical protein
MIDYPGGMAAKMNRVSPLATVEIEQRAREGEIPGVAFLDEDERMAMLDTAVRKQLSISGEEFIERWNAGKYAEIADKAGHWHLIDLAMLIPRGRPAPI